MALWFDIKVNQFTIGGVELVRTDPISKPEDNESCTYSLRYFDRHNRLAYDGKITHPYLPLNPLPVIIEALQQIERETNEPN